ncbi:50S ribosomal protein L11 methyltransferase [Ancylobacter sp. 6x-1]|uniref:Ribosomal protein L11 methyltransferase n=1 Tax=Ancylobacter crimeensis TaxID=2579147 RepID=A0ABT0DE69_9HYPH|nr:50S ribosomal protein L11 methyltransferase [Ancylobacter crimeensis]MCK0198254.1 50S ribosomal protein L11 methyltransferase [Ancylobacter crimeensis]
MLEGLPPNGASHVMRVDAPMEEARAIAEFIGETFDPAEVATSAFEIERLAEGSGWAVEIYFAEEPDEENVRELIALVSPEAAAAAVFSLLERKDWVAASLEGLAPVAIGPFVVHGSHDRARVPPSRIGIEIEAALAFGTGHHGTTQGCLEAIAAYGKRGRPRRTLDVGTGTGVLAMAAARLFHTPVLASDIDRVAVNTARANARANRAQGISFLHAPGLGARPFRTAGRFDLILANILLAPLKGIAKPMRPLLAAGGRVVLSGLLDSHANAALAAYRAQGLHLVRRRSIEGWTTLELAPHSGKPRADARKPVRRR